MTYFFALLSLFFLGSSNPSTDLGLEMDPNGAPTADSGLEMDPNG